MLEQLVDLYPDTVQIAYRHFPLNSIHPNAQKAAEASEAAGAQGQFWAYHDILFEEQGQWSSLDEVNAMEYFVSLAERLELDVDQFTQEVEDGIYADYVSSLEAEAVGLGLPGTPAAIVDGQIVAGQSLPMELDIWNNYIISTVAVAQLEEMQYDAAPEMALEDGKAYSAVVTMENGDSFTIELLPDSAPQTVNSFVFLSNEGWFDGVTFHRVLPGFVAQTGDPSATGMGGPGYTIPNEIDPELSHGEAGVVAMANSGPDTNGSQWYITYGDVSQLDGDYTIFGRVVEGMDVVEAITPRDPRDPAAPEGDKIESITIVIE